MSVPISLQVWAARWGLPPAALADLLQVLGVGAPPVPPPDPNRTSEAYVQSLVRLEAPKHGVWLTRNNVGVLKDINGRPVRYGLANESPAQNKVLKSGDLIGWRSFTIEQRHVGARFAQFVSRECKHVGWTWKGDEHEMAQLAWGMLVTAAGGDAQFVAGEGSFT